VSSFAGKSIARTKYTKSFWCIQTVNATVTRSHTTIWRKFTHSFCEETFFTTLKWSSLQKVWVNLLHNLYIGFACFSITFASKVRVSMSEAPLGIHSRGRFLALPANIRPGLKCWTVTNLHRILKSKLCLQACSALPPSSYWYQCYKTSILRHWQNKLDFYSFVKFPGNARAYPIRAPYSALHSG
jgi:hypothetical protein